ncbi:MAG: hypothetical protein EOP84_08965 [Verrucomicrobiaceae bacterium]|nr:MAG: hypothetical protein EOP84_08965 [Verrucomicrobiaceae bacterium]
MSRLVILFTLLLAMGTLPVMGQATAQERTTRVLAYRFDGGGTALSILTTSFDGVCNVTIILRSVNSSSEKTGQMDAGIFSKLMEGVSSIEAISSARLTDNSPTVDTETHHIITTLVRTPGGSKSEMYAVLAKDAPEAFLAWLKLLKDVVPKD